MTAKSLFWTAPDFGIPDGPYSEKEVFEEAASMARKFKEPVTIYSGPGITNWSVVDRFTSHNHARNLHID